MFSSNLGPIANTRPYSSATTASPFKPVPARLFVFTPTPLQVRLAIEDRVAFARQLNVEIGDDWPVFGESLEYAIQGYAEPANAGWGTWFGVELAVQRLVAVGGFHRPPDERGQIEFGYAISADARGRGLGLEFAATLLRHAVSDSRVQQVIAHTMADGQVSPEGFDNVASTAILRRLGFVHEGEDQGEWRWCLEVPASSSTAAC